VSLSAATRVAGVIGDPVRHSLSPIVHNAAFQALGLDWVYLAFPVATGEGAGAVAAMRTLGLDGLNVTMPHKADVLPALDGLSPTAAALGAANTIHRLGDELHGASTDGIGFVDALRHDEGFSPEGRRAVVFGAGGAARAVVLALAEAGAADVAVVNRTGARADAAVALAPAVARPGSEDDVDEADLVVNATPVGMDGTAQADAVLLDPRRLRAGQVVADLVYHPIRTPLLVAARERGAVAVTGLGMLIHQAAHAFRLWTGEDPPLEVMSAAALAALTHGG
jgi:shikimate dehydrogenase